MAARKGYLSIVTDLIEVIHVSIYHFIHNNMPLSTRFVIAVRGIMIFFTFQAGSEVDKKNEDEKTPLHLAAEEGRIM